MYAQTILSSIVNKVAHFLQMQVDAFNENIKAPEHLKEAGQEDYIALQKELTTLFISDVIRTFAEAERNLSKHRLQQRGALRKLEDIAPGHSEIIYEGAFLTLKGSCPKQIKRIDAKILTDILTTQCGLTLDTVTTVIDKSTVIQPSAKSVEVLSYGK